MPPRRPDSPLKPALRAAVQAVARALAALPVQGMLIGGIAVIIRGVPRLTRDVDATIAAGSIGLADLIERLREHQIVPRIEDAAEFAEAHHVLLLRHAPSGVDVDLSLGWLPFELDAMAAAQPLDVGGVRVAVARAEDLIVYKAVAFRPQDQQDIERLLVLHGDTVDLARIRQNGSAIMNDRLRWSAAVVERTSARWLVQEACESRGVSSGCPPPERSP